MTLNTATIAEAIMTATPKTNQVRFMGCCRVYVKPVSELIFQLKGHGVDKENALYIGYWNGDLDDVNEKAEGIAQALNDIGIKAMVEYSFPSVGSM